MVVLSSRKEAVRWQKAVREYIARQGYPLGVLVAFSGEIDDPDSFPEPVTEASKVLNPTLNRQDIREAFKKPEHHLLLVANKFQTGFDQPLLCGMYVDKRLGGIQAVQTLSRLNRSYPKKDTTYILDFVNEPAEILAAFKTYYTTAELEATTDPNQVFDLRAKLDASGHYDSFEVDRVAKVEIDPAGTQGQLSAAIAPVANRLMTRYRTAQEMRKAALAEGNDAAAQAATDTMDALLLFRNDMGAFNRLYSFLSQIFDYGNTDIEKRFIFYKLLIPLLEFGREREGVDLSKVVLTHHTLRSGGRQTLNLAKGEPIKLQPMDAVGTGRVQDKEKAFLDEIIERVNGLFGGQLSENDKLVYVNGTLMGKLLESDTLVQQAMSNTKAQFDNSPDLMDAVTHAAMDADEAYQEMTRQVLNSPSVKRELLSILLGPGQLWETLRAKGQQGRPTP
jgi:type I restriction enzyme R subunit